MKKYTFLILTVAVLTLCQGCIVCSADRVFPKVTWRWTRDGKREILSRQEAAEFAKRPRSEYQQ